MRLETPARRAVDEAIKAHATARLTLDLGCGPGRYAAYFPKRIAVDLALSPGVAVQASACELPFAASTFDVVLCTEMLEHVPEPPAAVDEMRRVLRPGGKCVLTTRFCYPLHDAPGDFFRFTEFGLRHLFRRWTSADIKPDTGLVGAVVPLVMARTAEMRGVRRKVATLAAVPTLLGLRALERVPSDTNRVSSGFIVVATR